MTTSLAAQLKRLAIPQTNVLKDSNKRVSLLFDPSEASKHSRDIVFEIGLSGLEDLCRRNAYFEEFKSNLFSFEERHMQRIVESKEYNSKLNKLLTKFLSRLSPYLLLNSSHKALEWLIYRFKIHELNVADVLALILPYHDTNIFVKILQLINLDSVVFKEWSWLKPVQKKGLHIPLQILVNHSISDTSFLRFVCDSTIKALKIHKKTKTESLIRTQMSFYCSLTVCVLARGPTDDNILNILLPSILTGLKSDVPDLTASAYAAVGQLSASNQLSPNLIDSLISSIVKDGGNLFKETRVFLLLTICQSQELSPKLPREIINWDWIPKILDNLSNTGVLVFPLLEAVIKSCISEIMGNGSLRVEAQVLCWNLVEQVHCDPANSVSLLGLLTTYYKRASNNKLNKKYVEYIQDVRTWLKTIIEEFCSKHGDDFDKMENDNKLKSLRMSWTKGAERGVDDPAISTLLRKCSGANQPVIWPQLKPLLMNQITDEKVFKAWCRVCPLNDTLTLLLCIQRLLNHPWKSNKRTRLITKIYESPYGAQNSIILRMKTLMDNDTGDNDPLENFLGAELAQLVDSSCVLDWASAIQEMHKCCKFRSDDGFWCFLYNTFISILPSEATSELVQHIVKTLLLIKRQPSKNLSSIMPTLFRGITNEENDDSWVDLSQNNLSMSLKLVAFEIIVASLDVAAKSSNGSRHLLESYIQECFPNVDDAVRFMFAVGAGPPTPSHVTITRHVQIHALNYAWKQIKSNNEKITHSKVLDLTPMVCYIMMSLGSSCEFVRRAALKVVESSVDALPENSTYYNLLQQILLRSDEIIADSDQLSVALFCLLSPNKSVQGTLDPGLAASLGKDRTALMSVFENEGLPLYIGSALSSLLESVNSVDIIKTMAHFANQALQPSIPYELRNTIMRNFWKRINETTVKVLPDTKIWDLAELSLRFDKGEGSSPAISFLKAVKKDVYGALKPKDQMRLMELLLKTRAKSENPEVASAVSIIFKKSAITAVAINDILTKTLIAATKNSRISASEVLESEAWRHGITLLELIQSKKKLENSKQLIAPFFVVLKFCLDQEEQTPFEYAKQLLLGCLQDFCERLVDSRTAAKGITLDVELIVQCLRASSNPQTHHHALLLLSSLASIIPTQVMHNMMAIFTFMGSSVTRLDDEHSVQVVGKVVDTVVPVLVKKLETEQDESSSVPAEVLRIFVWTLRDIPQHRRNPLFIKLLSTLDPDRSLWIFLLLICENYVLNAHRDNKPSEGSMPQSLQLGLEISFSFGAQTVLNTVKKLIDYICDIPIDRMNPTLDERMDVTENNNLGLFDVNKHSPKQLRHYNYTLMTFMNSLLSDNNFILQVRDLESTGANQVENIFKDIMASLLLYVPKCSVQFDAQQTKFWKVMITQGYDIMDRMVALVSSETLVNVLKKLLRHELEIIRRKSVDLLNVHIQNHRGGFSIDEKESLLQLLHPLLDVATSKPSSAPIEGELIQQTALLSLRLLAKVVADDDIEPFKQVLSKVCKLCKSKGHLLASVILTVADLVGHVKVHAVCELPNFLPSILSALKKYTKAESVDIVVMSLVAALHRIIDVLQAFLSPYIDDILIVISQLSVRWPDASDFNKKLLQIRIKVSGVAHRVLIQSIARSYTKLIEAGAFAAVGPLLSVLAESIVVSPDVSNLMPELSPFFMKALELRSDVVDGKLKLTDENVDLVEGFAVNTLLHFVLKLSEFAFKPMYYQLFHWTSEHPHRVITFYRISSSLAEKLKGLFVLFAGHFLPNAAKILDATNVTKEQEPYFGDCPGSEKKAIMLLESIIQTLHTVFMFDSTNFLKQDKFQILLQPLIDQLENTLGGPDALEERTKRLLTPCIAQMTLATDDTQWKALNYQLLMKTRSPSPPVRIAALNTIVEVAAKLGEDYLTLLPETIGSLAELLEDEDERVELAMKEALRRMEDVLGQPIRDYFQ